MVKYQGSRPGSVEQEAQAITVWLVIGRRARRALDRLLGPKTPRRVVADVYAALDALDANRFAGCVADERLLRHRPGTALGLLQVRLHPAPLLVAGRGRDPALARAVAERGIALVDAPAPPRPPPRRLEPDPVEPAGSTPSPEPARADPLPRADGTAAVAVFEPGRFAEASLGHVFDLAACASFIVETFRDASGATRVTLMLREGRRDRLVVHPVRVPPEPSPAGMRTRFGHGLAGRAAALGRVVCGRGDRGGPRRYPGRSYVILPLGTGQRCEGVVNLTGLPGDILPSDEVLTGWRRIAEVAGRALGAAQRFSRVAADAGADAVTGLPNRRTFDRVLDRELERAARSTGALTLVLFDVDHFRRVNNTYGHASGDRVLSEVARRLCAAFRQTDLVTRWGGEEFAAILPQTGSPGSEDPTAPAERARRLVGDRPVLLDGGQRCSVTISGGVAVCPHDARDAAGLVAHADRGLYEAKGGGRNRIVRAPPGDDVDGAAGGRAGPQA